jgi:ribonuclease VapC
VIDASAVLALLHAEPGHERVLDHIEGAVMSTVNWSEVIGRHGGPATSLRQGLEAVGLSIVDFTIEDAELAAAMLSATKWLGLGVADRACLALGHRLDVSVVTADRKWDELNFGPPIVQIRGG